MCGVELGIREPEGTSGPGEILFGSVYGERDAACEQGG